MGRPAKINKKRGQAGGAASDAASSRRRQMTIDDIAQSVGRSSRVKQEQPANRPVLKTVWRWLIQTPLGRLVFGILAAALLLAAVLLAVGNQFDRFYLILGLLILLAAVMRWIFFIRRDALRHCARPGSDDGTPPGIVNKP